LFFYISSNLNLLASWIDSIYRYILCGMFIKAVTDALNNANITYALVGGYAVALHGAVRGTIDLDFVIALEQTQYENVENALIGIGLVPRLPISAKDVFQFREEYIEKRNLIAWSFINQANPLEVVDIIITHDAKKMQTKTLLTDGMTIQIATKDELIKMKKASGRPQDLADVDALEKL